jgi:hypothetical protein
MRYILICSFILVQGKLLGQNIFNSPYSIYGLGIMNERLSTLNRGMGGTGIAVRDEFNLNYTNPASYGSIQSPVSSIYEMGFYIENNNYKTKELNESKSNGSLTNINYWFKFKPYWSSMVGLSPFSSVSYKITTTRNLGSGSPVDYSYDGSGAISRFYWGNAFTITKNLSIGFNASFLFGSISKKEFIITPGGTGSVTFENKINARKVNIDAGIQYSFKLKKDRTLLLGIVGDPGMTFNASQKNYVYNENSDTLNATIEDKQKYDIPATAGVGAALQTRRSVVATDVKFEHWSSVTSPERETTPQDTWKFSVGYMYKGNPDATNYWGSVSLRAGFFTQNYYQKIKDNTLPWWGMSLGVSMPVFDNRSSINLTYSLDRLGTLNDGLILQRSQKIMIDVVIRDLWGMKRKFD